MLSAELAIRAKGLSKRYAIGTSGRRGSLRGRLAAGDWWRGRQRTTFWALKDVSFDVRQGDVVGIIGRNGAGKSTLLKILSRITEPTEGVAQIRGRLGSLLEVGTGFHPELTGRENIYLNGAILGMKRKEIDRKFDEIVAFAEVDEFIDTPVKRYSSGMHVRLAFAVAAHLEPDVLIVDEVLAVGDFAFQRKCLGKMQDEAGSGRTVIFVSHNLGAVRLLCNRCLCLERGQIIADGPTAEVVDTYLARAAAATAAASRGTVESDRRDGYRLHRKNSGGELQFFCGDAITLDFDIEAPAPIPESHAGVGVTIVGEEGDPIVSMSSPVQRAPADPGTSRFWRVRCDMGRLPLNAGTYYASVYVGDGMRSGGVFTRAIAIRMFEEDVFGWGNSLPGASYWGPMYWAPRWKIKPVQVSAGASADGLEAEEIRACQDFSES